jgi:1,2-dihydroxy-3-keto-5-methylthiopentene dioxygenase
MSQLTVYAEDRPDAPILETTHYPEIRATLAEADILLDRWAAATEITDGMDDASILSAYRREIDRLVADKGYKSYDVISMGPDHPDKVAFRQKFLAEHTHADDEVRFFVRGQGLFMIHASGRVYAMLCDKDDLISVPADTRHWFDMGPNPRFTVIRLFDRPEGWVAEFTGDDIADRFPLLDN